MTKTHQCLTEEVVLGLAALPLPPPYPSLVFSALEHLSQCDECWKPIQALRNQPPSPPSTRSPFASIFHTLITRRVPRASHRAALDSVRKSSLGLYRLLLEEIATLLPINQAAKNQQALLLFELLLEKVKDSSPQWHDLAARASVVQGQLWFRYGDPGRATEEYSKALYHKGRGTGDKELHATILASQGELLHAAEPSKAMGKLVRALNLVAELPLRRLELLWQLASLHLDQQEFEEAWQLLLDAENLADEHEHEFLEAIWHRLMEVEAQLVQFGEAGKRTLYHCLGHYHSRCLGFEVHKTTSPPEISQIQGLRSNHQRTPRIIECLCLCWSAGHPIGTKYWQELQHHLTRSALGRAFFEAMYTQLANLWERYPTGRLAHDFLEPFLGYLDRACPTN